MSIAIDGSGLFGDLNKAMSQNSGGGGKYGLKHPDGTPCDAKKPENCPLMGGSNQNGLAKQDNKIDPSKIDASKENAAKSELQRMLEESSGSIQKSIESEISKALQEYQKIGTQTLPKDIEELLNPSKFFDDEDNNPWGQQKVPRWNPSGMTWEDRVGKPKKPYFVQKPTSKPEESSEGRDLTWKVPDEYDPNQELDEEQTHFEREQYFESCKPGTKVTMSYGRTAVKNEDGSWTVTTPRRQEGYNPGRDEYDDGGSTSDIVYKTSKKTSKDIARYSNCKVNGKHIDSVCPPRYKKKKFDEELLWKDTSEYKPLR